MERRFIPAGQVRLARADGKPTKITGYAARFYDGSDATEFELYSTPGYRVVERIMAGTFSRALQSAPDCRALFNHDPSNVLGRTSSGTLRLSQDSKGLAYEIDAPDTQCARDVMTSIDRGDITGSSFAFDARGENIRKVIGADDSVTVIRELTDVDLFDVGPVTYPAYEGSSTGLRAAGQLEEIRAKVDAFLATESAPPLAARHAKYQARAREMEAGV